MTVGGDSTRDGSGREVEPPVAGVGADAMKAAVARELFGDIAEPLSIGRYNVKEALGEGGMGVVYAAWDSSLGRPVALKVLAPGAATSQKRRARMVREAQALAKLSHPNVVQVYEVGEDGQDVFVAMELIEGPSLRDWLRQSERSMREVSEVFIQAGRGLGAAHRVGLVHRDFKPTNVIVGTDGRVRVVDFGLAHGRGLSTESAESVGGRSSNDKLTRTGTVLGTPAYMAPEQFRGETVDARADQFSFCVALFEAVAGSRPYNARTLQDDPARAVVTGWERVPRRWRAPLRRGLAIHAIDRWPELDGLLSALSPSLGFWSVAPWVPLGGLALTIWAAGSKGDPCESLGNAPQGWDHARADRVREAFRGTGAPFADDVWTSASAELDAFANSWTASREGICSADSTPEAIECLERAEATMQSVLEAYESVTPSNVGTTHRLAELLATPRSCAINPRTAFGGQLEVGTIADLTRLQSMVTANRPHEAMQISDRLIGEARYHDTDALAELYALRAQSLAMLAQHDKVAREFGRSVATANSPGARARQYLAWADYLLDIQRVDSASDTLFILESLVGKESPAAARAGVLKLRARTRLDATLSDKLSDFEKALHLHERSGDQTRAASTRMSIANLLSEDADEQSLTRAQEIYRAELADRRRRLGDLHPATAVAMFNLAVFLADVRLNAEAALQLLRATEAIDARTLPADSTSRARTRLKMGEVLLNLDRQTQAAGVIDSAWSVLASLPEEHTDHLAGRTLLARYTMDRGEYSQSLEHHRVLAAADPDNPFVQQNIAFMSAQLRDPDTAKLAVARARTLTASAGIDEATLELLELYFRTIDARVAHVEGRPDDATEIVSEIETSVRNYEVPDGRPDLERQLKQLSPELDEFRKQLVPE